MTNEHKTGARKDEHTDQRMRLAPSHHPHVQGNDLAIHTTGLPQTHHSGALASFFVLGLGESAHWTALALMACLRERGYRITALMPLARDAQWQQGRWRSERVSQLQAASSFHFPASALCTAPMPDPAGSGALVLHTEAVEDSLAVLSTWADVVVVDGEGDPDAVLVPGITLGDVAQALGLPVVVVCEDHAAAVEDSCELVSRCCQRGIRVAGWVLVGSHGMACSEGIPLLGAIPLKAMRDPAVAARHVDVQRLMDVLRLA